jgi:hypothetical protein
VRKMIPSSGSNDTINEASFLANSSSTDTISTTRSLRRSTSDISQAKYYPPFRNRFTNEVVDPVFNDLDQSSASLSSLRAAFLECEERDPGSAEDVIKKLAERMT